MCISAVVISNCTDLYTKLLSAHEFLTNTVQMCALHRWQVLPILLDARQSSPAVALAHRAAAVTAATSSITSTTASSSSTAGLQHVLYPSTSAIVYAFEHWGGAGGTAGGNTGTGVSPIGGSTTSSAFSSLLEGDASRRCLLLQAELPLLNNHSSSSASGSSGSSSTAAAAVYSQPVSLEHMRATHVWAKNSSGSSSRHLVAASVSLQVSLFVYFCGYHHQYCRPCLCIHNHCGQPAIGQCKRGAECAVHDQIASSKHASLLS
jgi:hypothetical protein